MVRVVVAVAVVVRVVVAVAVRVVVAVVVAVRVAVRVVVVDMTRKHYKIIAENIRREVDACRERMARDNDQIRVNLVLISLVSNLCRDLKDKNIHFNAEKFTEACGFGDAVG